MNNKSQAYILSLQMYANCCRNGQFKRVTLEQYSEMVYEKVDTGLQEQFVPEQLTIIDTQLFKEDLSPRATKLLMQITSELYMNNCLWYYDHLLNSRDRSAVAELRDRGILFKTEDPRIHYVNPDRIRRGSKPQVLACTTKELETVSRVTRDNIRNLGYRENKVAFNLLDVSTR